MRTLVTGGAGFIGSHACVSLIEAGHDPVVVDNLCNSSAQSLRRVRDITGREPVFHRADIRDRNALDDLFRREGPFDAVLHFAALKSVTESTRLPLTYYGNNITGTVTLCEAMMAAGCRNLVFSSSASVYGQPACVPVREDAPTPGATNPYGWSKLMMEQALRDAQLADPAWKIILLRYFNPVGAHPSGLIGESPTGIPNNLAPFVAQVAAGKRPCLSVYGNDYPTPDGTGVRDYIHVVDLAEGHVRALDRLAAAPGLKIYNLGAGRGYSVLEVIQAFERVSGRPIPYVMAPRRPGDIAACWADPTRAERDLNWKARRSLDEMCADAWRWQVNNPDGFDAV